MGINPGGLGLADPRCPETTWHQPPCCKITTIRFFANSELTFSDRVALEPTRELVLSCGF